MEPWVASVVTALIGGMVVTVGYAVSAARRNGKNGQANNLVELLLEHQGRIAASLERIVSIHEHSEERLQKIEEGQDQLVRIHLDMETRRQTLREVVDKGGHS